MDQATDAIIPYPDFLPSHFNATRYACDMLQGPCICRAFHKLQEWGVERYAANMLPWQFHMVQLGEVKHRQGYSPFHRFNPFHEVITAFGWAYSHTTIITSLEGKPYPHLTYLNGQHAVGVSTKDGRWLIEAGMLGSGHTYLLHNPVAYLKRKKLQLESERNAEAIESEVDGGLSRQEQIAD